MFDRRITSSVLVVLIISFITGCSHKTLSFFFDGVPASIDSTNIASADSIIQTDSTRYLEVMAQVTTPVFNYHSPYKDKDCGMCHDQNSMGKFVEPQPALCYQCHDDFANSYSFLHAPVEGGECTSCHNPHMATEDNLLLRNGQPLCFYCHDNADILKMESHGGIEDTHCTDCHNPHGGSDEFLLNWI